MPQLMQAIKLLALTNLDLAACTQGRRLGEGDLFGVD